MKIHYIVLAALLIAGCASTPEPISSEPILNWFHIGETKAEAVTFIKSLGYSEELIVVTRNADGSERLVFPFFFQKGTAPREHLGTFELLFSPEGIIQSGRKLNEGQEQSPGTYSSRAENGLTGNAQE
jgi:hypothetical protein